MALTKKEYSIVDVVLSPSHSASSLQPHEINLWLKRNHEKENGKKKKCCRSRAVLTGSDLSKNKENFSKSKQCLFFIEFFFQSNGIA